MCATSAWNAAATKPATASKSVSVSNLRQRSVWWRLLRLPIVEMLGQFSCCAAAGGRAQPPGTSAAHWGAAEQQAAAVCNCHRQRCCCRMRAVNKPAQPRCCCCLGLLLVLRPPLSNNGSRANFVWWKRQRATSNSSNSSNKCSKESEINLLLVSEVCLTRCLPLTVSVVALVVFWATFQLKAKFSKYLQVLL